MILLILQLARLLLYFFALQGTKYQKSANDPVKYFNTISGYKIEKYQRGGQTQQQAPPPPQPQGVQSPAPQPGKDDDLPF